MSRAEYFAKTFPCILRKGAGQVKTDFVRKNCCRVSRERWWMRLPRGKRGASSIFEPLKGWGLQSRVRVTIGSSLGMGRVALLLN